jgi:hypothetical protein
MSSLIASFTRCSLMKCPIYYSKLDPALHASAHHGAISSSPQVPNLVLQAAKALGQVGALPHYAKAKEPIKTALRAKLPDLRTGGTESDLDVAVDIEHASAHRGALSPSLSPQVRRAIWTWRWRSPRRSWRSGRCAPPIRSSRRRSPTWRRRTRSPSKRKTRRPRRLPN